ncbi:hypothetical protein MHYP_G00276050 [Metynnis hypsauchen]
MGEYISKLQRQDKTLTDFQSAQCTPQAMTAVHCPLKKPVLVHSTNDGSSGVPSGGAVGSRVASETPGVAINAGHQVALLLMMVLGCPLEHLTVQLTMLSVALALAQKCSLEPPAVP